MYIYTWRSAKHNHYDVIKWKHFRRYWPFVQGIHRSPVNSPHKGQWRGALMFSLICAWINGWVNNHEAGGLRRHRAHYDITATEPSLNAVNTATPIPRFRYIPISHDNLYYRILNQFPDSTHPVNVSWYTGIGPVSAKCCLHPNDCGPVLTCLDRKTGLERPPDHMEPNG